MQSDELFSQLNEAAASYCSEYGIEIPHEPDAGPMSRARCNVLLPTSLQDSVVLTTLNKRQVISLNECNLSTPCQQDPDNLSSNLRQQMFAVLDNMTAELERRFSDTQPLLLCCHFHKAGTNNSSFYSWC